MFTAFKHLHMTMAFLSILLLVIRFAIDFLGQNRLNKPWLKILSHSVVALLIVTIIGMLSSVSTFPAGFISEKALFFILYVVFSMLCALSMSGKLNRNLRIPTFAAAVLSWLWLIYVAFSKSPILLS